MKIGVQRVLYYSTDFQNFADVENKSCSFNTSFEQNNHFVFITTLKTGVKILCASKYQVSIVHKLITGRYRPVRVAHGPITARCRFIKNASRVSIKKNRGSFTIDRFKAMVLVWVFFHYFLFLLLFFILFGFVAARMRCSYLVLSCSLSYCY